ncbi:MAG: hypothetical protein WAO19_14545, partial [Candidatus Kryptoniota bacterium]
MYHLKKIFLLGVIIMSARSTSAQQNLVNLSVNVPQVSQIYAADLDIQHTKSSSLLFVVTLQSMARTQIMVSLYLTVNVKLVGENQFQLAQATTQPITLNPGQVKVITNVDLSGPTASVPINNYTYDEQQFDRIKNVALATGKVPAGVYDFNVQCFDANRNPASNSAFGQIVVTNPSRVDLVLPMNGENVTTLFPHFQWSADVDTVVVSVYQMLPNQQSAQDVVSGVPFLQETIPNASSPFPNSFNYPSSGAGVRPLEAGKTYYWFVNVPASSTGGSGIQS